MKDGLNVIVVQQVGDSVDIADVNLVEICRFGNCPGISTAKVVDDGDVVASLHQLMRCMGSNVSGTAGD
jgi:hypothetical protein